MSELIFSRAYLNARDRYLHFIWKIENIMLRTQVLSKSSRTRVHPVEEAYPFCSFYSCLYCLWWSFTIYCAEISDCIPVSQIDSQLLQQLDSQLICSCIWIVSNSCFSCCFCWWPMIFNLIEVLWHRLLFAVGAESFLCPRHWPYR
jgi:hypothetical protein